jgi:hypothetical protein
MRLCDDHPIARVLAAVRLGEVGTLDDIGLFADLLALPPCADEHPRERAAMIHSMWRLAGKTPEPFDLSDLVGLSPAPEKCAPPSDQAAEPSEEPATELARPAWKCAKCGNRVPGNFQVCWNCGTSQDGAEDPGFRRIDDK